ncbi:MAG: LptF/LptG family permease [Ghiorsea sp.]|nr:LptF/LptG family permease [Ghiorsea sp.]
MFPFSCLSKYIFKNWLIPFVGILLLVSTVFMLQKVLFWLPRLIENDVPLSLALQLFSHLIPTTLLLVIPVSYFFALYRLVKHLQNNSELDAFYAGGLSLFNIFRPVLLAGILLSLVLLWMNMVTIPASKMNMYNTIAQLSAIRALPNFVPQQFSDVEGMTFYSEGQKSDGTYIKVLIADERDDSQNPILYFANQANISTSDIGLLIQLQDGHQLTGAKDKLNLTRFEAYRLQVPLVFEHGFTTMKPESDVAYMDAKRLYQHLQEDTHPRSLAEWQRRWIPSISIIILFFLAIPLSLQAKRSSKGGSFVLALLVLAMIEQIQLVTHRKIGLDILPWWSTWAIEVGYMVIALWLFFVVNKYGNLSFKNMKKSLGKLHSPSI